MSTNAYIGLIQPNQDVRYIYCHWDGYISHTGEILFNYYNDVNSINELLDLGDLSAIGTSLDSCVAYGRDRGEANCEAIIGSASDMDQEYNYLFNPNENAWMVKCRDTGYDWDYLDDWVDSNEPDIVGSTRLRKSSVTANKRIEAADDEKVDPRIDRADELQDRIEDDFDYVLAGIERLGREGKIDAAIDIMEKIASTLDAAIGVIGEDFVSEEGFDEEI